MARAVPRAHPARTAPATPPGGLDHGGHRDAHGDRDGDDDQLDGERHVPDIGGDESTGEEHERLKKESSSAFGGALEASGVAKGDRSTSTTIVAHAEVLVATDCDDVAVDPGSGLARRSPRRRDG